MGHDRDTGLDQQPDLLVGPLAALQLDRADARLLDQPGGVAERLYGTFLVRAEGQIRDDHGALGAAYDGGGQHGDLVHRDGHGGLVAEVDVAHRVPDEHDRDPGLVEDGRGHRVVGGEHGPLLAALGGGGDVVDGDAAGGLPSVQRFAAVGGRARGGGLILRSLKRHGQRLLRHLEAP